MKIGLIGLGIMGLPMGKNLLKAGYELYVNDRNEERVKEIEKEGAVPATYEEIGKNCEVVLTMLPNSPHVKSVMLGKDGLVNMMKEGQVFIDMSSINPIASQEIKRELEKKALKLR